MAAEDMSGWQRDGETLVRELKFDDFAQAMAYVNRVAELAEEVNHHPDILVHG
jgi:4a-hydroxytetrahydrobiopterin dehydratase